MNFGNFQKANLNCVGEMKFNNEIRPPRLADRIFEWYCENACIEDLHGDLEELFYADLGQMTGRKAKIKYWQRVISLMFSYAIKSRKRKSGDLIMFIELFDSRYQFSAFLISADGFFYAIYMDN